MKWVLAVGMLAGAFALLMAGSASAAQSGSNYTSGSGNWVVSSPTVVQNEVVDVNGVITVSSTFDLMNVTIRFTVPTGSIVIAAPNGGMTMAPGAGAGAAALITTTNNAYYWTFNIANTTSNVNFQNTTMDHINNGVTITGGTASARYFAYVTVTHANLYGFRLTDSFATLFHVAVTLEFSPTVIHRDWDNRNYVSNKAGTTACSLNSSSNSSSTYNNIPYYYGGFYRYRCINDFWSATGTGYLITRGGPNFDTIDVHIPAGQQRLDIALMGGIQYWVNYSYYPPYNSVCYQSGAMPPHYWYDYNYTYHYQQVFLSYNGTIATDAVFAQFKDVHTPPEDVFLDIHYNLVGQYIYTIDYCGYSPTQNGNYPDYVYSYNRIDVTAADVVGIKVTNGRVGDNFNNLNLSMGKSGAVFTSDWGGSAAYQGYFLQSYASFATPNAYSFWSIEQYPISTAQATTRTDFALRNSKITGAGARFDRSYTYSVASQPGGAADTVFRGIVTVDNVSATNIQGVGLDIRINGLATQTPNVFNYTASVTNSVFSASRSLSISLQNLQSTQSNYTSSFLLENNVFKDASVPPPSTALTQTTGYSYTYIYGGTWVSAVLLDVGWHPSTLGGDWYKADAVLRNNTFVNMTGNVISFPYADTSFPGGSSLTLQGNSFRTLRNFQTGAGVGVLTPVMAGDEIIRTMVDRVVMQGNTFDDVSMSFGIVGSFAGTGQVNAYNFAYCAYYLQTYGYNYWYYGCSWPGKTPTVIVESNIFNNVRITAGAPRDSAFILMPGHMLLTFNNNTISNSAAPFVNAYFTFYYQTYQFTVANLDARIQGNTIRGQTTVAAFLYTDPFLGGNPIQVLNNDFRDSSAPLFTWQFAYYSAMSVSYRQTENLATMIVADNVIKNVTTGQNPVFGLTGRATIINNSFENVIGWAIKVDFMSKVPTLSATNRLLNVTNGYWIAPINTGQAPQTTTLKNLTVIVAAIAIRWENGNLILQNADFGTAITPLVMVNGHADIYSSNVAVLSTQVTAGGSVSVYNLLGFSIHWGNANGVDSGVEVANAALVTSSAQHKILTSGRADAHGQVAAKLVLVWEQFSFGASYEGHVYAPFEVLIASQGVSQLVRLPDLGPGEVPTKFQDYPSYPALLKDTMVPTISVGTPTAGSTLGHVAIPIEGHSFERGSGINTQRVRLDSQPWIDIATTGASTWQLMLMADGEGTHTIFGEITDFAGNAYTMQLPFTVDITPPTLEITDPLVNFLNTRDPTYIVQGHVEPASSEVDINGISVPVLGRGEFATEFTLLDGLNVLFITAEDAAGNQVTVVRYIYFDQYAPFIQVTSPTFGLKTSKSLIDIEGRAEPGSTVTVNGIPAVASPIDGSFIIRNFVLADLYAQTENLLLIKATDQVGNFAWDNRSVTVDINAPKITLELDPAVASRIANGQPVSANSLDVRGKIDSADAILMIGGQEVPLSGLGFSRVMVLAEGRNTIELSAEDDVGNVRTMTLVIFRDTSKPTLTIDRPAEHTVLTNQRTLEIRGTTDAAGATVYLEYNNSVGAPVQDALPAVAVGYPISYRFERLLDLVSDGNIHQVVVRVVDAAGNEARDSIAYTSKVTPPQVTLLNMQESTTDTFVWVNGSTDEGITHVRINGQVFDVEGRFFSVRWNLPITTGDYTFRVSVVDAAGNLGTTEATVHVNVARPGGGIQTTPSSVSPELLTGGMLGLLGVAVAVMFIGYTRRKGQA